MAQPDPQLSNLLKWAVENSTEDVNGADPSGAKLRGAAPNPEALAALFGGKSDAELMKETMAAIQHPDVSVPNKLVAFDNFEQLVESIDNANNLEPLGLWAPLIHLLGDADAEMRCMAAWCVGTAVQNNPKAQKVALDAGAFEPLVRMAKEEKDRAAQRKACYAISSEVRNFQPGLDKVLELLGREQKMDATDMESIDALLQELRME